MSAPETSQPCQAGPARTGSLRTNSGKTAPELLGAVGQPHCVTLVCGQPCLHTAELLRGSGHLLAPGRVCQGQNGSGGLKRQQGWS